MFNLDQTLEFLAFVALFWYWMFEGFYRAVIPIKYQFKKKLNGEVALVTGGGNGIGRGIAVKLANMGCRVVIWDIDQSGMDGTVEIIRSSGYDVHAYKVDLTNREQIYEVAELVRSDVGDVTLLVNNAGVGFFKPLLELTDEQIELTMSVNINAHFWTTKAFLPAMMEKDHGHIVSIASISGLTGIPNLTDYSGSKFATVGFMDSLSLELQGMHKKIHFTTVAPNYVKTGLTTGVKQTRMMPLLDIDYTVQCIIDGIVTYQSLLIIPPRSLLTVLVILRTIFPAKAQVLLFKYLRVHESSTHITARKIIKGSN